MTITTEEAQLLAQTHDLARFTLGMKTPEHDLTATVLRSLAAERDALRTENARLRAALSGAEAWVERWTPHVGRCSGKDESCECGRAFVLHDARTALGETQ
jgi:hypothetical protein